MCKFSPTINRSIRVYLCTIFLCILNSFNIINIFSRSVGLFRRFPELRKYIHVPGSSIVL
jgi:hypothetical protein